MPVREEEIQSYDLSKALGIPAKKVIGCLAIALGQKVNKGDLIAQKSGLKKKSFTSPIEGVLDSLTEEGVLKIKPVLSEKKEAEPSFPSKTLKVEAEWGWGSPGTGELLCLSKGTSVLGLKGDLSGKVLAFFGPLTRGIWHKAKSLGVKGIVCGSLPDEEFKEEVQKEILLVVGDLEKEIYLPLLVSGKGREISLKIWQTLEKAQGKRVFLDGGGKRLLVEE